MAKGWELRGIFCIETIWFGDTDKTSMRPALQYQHDVYGTPFLHRDAITREEFFRYFDMWGKMKCGEAGEDEQYPILILAYHGDTGGILLTDQPESRVDLQCIAQSLRGKCRNKVIHFGSCSTINDSNGAICEFLEVTCASAVSGYENDVDWTWSMAFDLLYLQAIQAVDHKYLTPECMKEVDHYLTNKRWEDLGEEPYPYDAVREQLGFNIRVRSKPA